MVGDGRSADRGAGGAVGGARAQARILPAFELGRCGVRGVGAVERVSVGGWVRAVGWLVCALGTRSHTHTHTVRPLRSVCLSVECLSVCGPLLVSFVLIAGSVLPPASRLVCLFALACVFSCMLSCLRSCVPFRVLLACVLSWGTIWIGSGLRFREIARKARRGASPRREPARGVGTWVYTFFRVCLLRAVGPANTVSGEALPAGTARAFVATCGSVGAQ